MIWRKDMGEEFCAGILLKFCARLRQCKRSNSGKYSRFRLSQTYKFMICMIFINIVTTIFNGDTVFYRLTII